VALINRLVDIHLSEKQIKKVLDERATALAEPLCDEADRVATTQYVVFQLGQERYGLDIQLIEEIQPVRNLTLVPCTPDFVVGAINVRGSVLPIIDIKSFFGLPNSQLQATSKTIVIKAGDIRLGILTDQVEGVRDIGRNDIGSVAETLPRAAEDLIVGVTKEAVVVLDGATLVNNNRLIIHEEA
jgi:purine-binding chemotaxis protein CheW